MKRESGFTLVEVMVVVVIVAILASVALPAYNGYVIRGKIADATSTLSALRVKMEQFYQDNRSYQNAGGNCGIGATPTATKYFTYSCATPDKDSYVITATGTGNLGDFKYTVDQSNGKTSNITRSGWNNPSPNNCWATKSDGSC